MARISWTLPARRRVHRGQPASQFAPRAGHDGASLCSPRNALLIAVWFGLATGLAELALGFIQKPLTDPSPGLFRMNRYMLWSVPVVNVAFFGLCGLTTAAVLRGRPHPVFRAAVAPPAVLAVLTLLLSCRWLHALACVLLCPLLVPAHALARESSVRLPRVGLANDACSCNPRARNRGGVASAHPRWFTACTAGNVRGPSRSQRPAGRAGHRASRPSEPAWLPSRYLALPDAAGETPDHFHAGAARLPRGPSRHMPAC